MLRQIDMPVQIILGRRGPTRSHPRRHRSHQLPGTTPDTEQARQHTHKLIEHAFERQVPGFPTCLKQSLCPEALFNGHIPPHKSRRLT